MRYCWPLGFPQLTIWQKVKKNYKGHDAQRHSKTREEPQWSPRALIWYADGGPGGLEEEPASGGNIKAVCKNGDTDLSTIVPRENLCDKMRHIRLEKDAWGETDIISSRG